MRVLLVNPPAEFEGRIFKRAGVRWPSLMPKYKDLKDPTRYVPFPLFLAYTAAILKEKNIQTYAIDAVALQMDDKTFISEAKKRAPDAIIMETSTPTINLDIASAKALKKATGAIIVLVGPHATVFPEEMLKNDFIDYVAIGEYEYTVRDLIANLKDKKSVLQIPGLAHKAKGSIKINSHRELIDPLDALPYPQRDLFPIDDAPDISIYQDGMSGMYSPSIKVQTSRGCPFRCNYCLWTQVIYPGKYRVYSVKRVVDEIEHVIKTFGAKMIYFDDDTFTVKKDHVIGICDELISRKIKIPWAAMCDAILIDLNMIIKMADAGCISAMFGLESANKEILKRIGKPLNLDKLRQVLKWCHECGIATHVTNCYGMSGDTPETIRETLEFTKKLDVDSAQFSIAIPYPGTRFYNEAKENGWLRAKRWEDFDGRPIIERPKLSIKEMEQLCDFAEKEFMKAKRRDVKWLARASKRRYKQSGIIGLIKSARNYTKLLIEGK